MSTEKVAYERARRRQRAYGLQAFVDADPVREHVRALQATGLGLRRICELADMSPGNMKRLIYGDVSKGRAPSRRVRPATAAAILAVRPDPELLAPGAQIDATGTRRRLQALQFVGWPKAALAARLGMHQSPLGRLMRSTRTTVATFRAVMHLYDELWDVEPPTATPGERNGVARARGLAAREGWAPPLAWDDDTIDDPAATPQHAMTGPVPPRRRIHFEDVEFLLESGNSIELIADRLGAKPSTIERYAGVIAAGAQDTWRNLADERTAGAA